jgi:TonB family protein
VKARNVLLVGLPLLATGVAGAAPPPEDVPWRAYEEPAFPSQLLSTLIHDGFASVIFTFDETGRITDRVVLHASHPAFVAAIFEAARHWEIDTARLPRFIRRETVYYRFQRDRVIINRTEREAMKAAFTPFGDEKGTAFNTCREDELGVPLQMVASIVPEFPPALKGAHVRGSATVSFIVDAEGRVRVPAVTGASEPAFGEAILAAVGQWRFATPQLGGRPIQVMVERTFSFGAPPQTK